MTFKLKPTSESTVLASILAALGHKNAQGAIEGRYGLFWRNNSGAMKVGARFIRYGLPGSPDVIGIVNGQFVGIEVKREDGKQSEHQQEFERLATKYGGHYAVVRSAREAIESVVRWYNESQLRRSKP